MAPSFQLLVLTLAICGICLNMLTPTAQQSPGLERAFYRHSCPPAESIVFETLKCALDRDPGLAGAFLRLMFHDCYIRGCDASVLIDSTPNNKAEKDGTGNNNGSLRGFEVLDAAKARIEAQCPGVVSCADILVYAARDSVFLSGGPWYYVPGGRRDGTVSLASDTSALPSPRLAASQFVANFTRLGLTQEDLVTLSGAHTIGQARCISVQATRLATPQNPPLDPAFASELRAECGGANSTSRIFMDPDSPKTFDNGYYKDLVANKGLFLSDQSLYDDPATRDLVVFYSQNLDLFASKFAEAMGKLGALNVLTGDAGQIRLDCHRINP